MRTMRTEEAVGADRLLECRDRVTKRGALGLGRVCRLEVDEPLDILEGEAPSRIGTADERRGAHELREVAPMHPRVEELRNAGAPSHA